MNTDDDEPEAELGPPEHLSAAKGMDLVRRVLEEARGAARTRAKTSAAVAGCRRAGGWPAPKAGGAGLVRVRRRDPQPLAGATRDVAKKQGWSPRVAEGAVFGRWAAVVGAQISEHASPTGLRDGVLSVTAESTAWATQLRLIQKPGAGQDRGGGRRRCGDQSADHRPDRAVVA